MPKAVVPGILYITSIDSTCRWLEWSEKEGSNSYAENSSFSFSAIINLAIEHEY